jgi:RNA polymerase sigma-70 factor (ECF subfamily)
MLTDIEQIYTENLELVYKYILSLCRDKELAEDITQETFFKAIKNINNFKGESKLSVWLCGIAKNLYYDFLRKKHKHSKVYVDSTSTNSFEENLLKREAAFEIQKIIHLMSDPYKEVFMMRLYGEMSYRQISEIFGKTETWARVTYYRAKQMIREEFEK